MAPDADPEQALPSHADVPSDLREKVAADFERFAQKNLPDPVEEYVKRTYGLDLASDYGGLPVRNPFGKGAGQLSLNARQVRRDAESQLGFVALKSVVAQDEAGACSMQDWTKTDPRMVVEPIVSAASGKCGWTVTWKGRGWSGSLGDYLALVLEAVPAARAHGTLVVPTCIYPFPAAGETDWSVEEYAYTTRELLRAWRDGGGRGPVPVEIDLSPTLAGAPRGRDRGAVEAWVSTSPRLVYEAAGEDRSRLHLGMKVFNAVFDDEFQLRLLELLHAAPAAERVKFFVYGNRLYDPDKEFRGTVGVAYGGPDLSDRNLRVLDLWAERGAHTLPRVGTGNIHSGKMAVQYLLRGCTSFAMHTLFQLPPDEFLMKRGTRTERVLHRLLFDPRDGFIVWMAHLGRSAVTAA